MQAAEVTVTTAEGLIFSLNEEDHIATLKKVSNAFNATDVTVPATITVDGIKYKVTGIASKAFMNSKYITKVTIGKSAFKGIGSKAIIKVPESKYKDYKRLLKKKGIGKTEKLMII